MFFIYLWHIIIRWKQFFYFIFLMYLYNTSNSTYIMGRWLWPSDNKNNKIQEGVPISFYFDWMKIDHSYPFRGSLWIWSDRTIHYYLILQLVKDWVPEFGFLVPIRNWSEKLTEYKLNISPKFLHYLMIFHCGACTIRKMAKI